jgi:hypothetical protein
MKCTDFTSVPVLYGLTIFVLEAVLNALAVKVFECRAVANIPGDMNLPAHNLPQTCGYEQTL